MAKTSQNYDTDIPIRQKSNTSPLADGSSFTKQEEMKQASKAYQVTTADDKANTAEPQSAYAPEYPYNDVHASMSGHWDEVDDSPGAERLSRGHKSGTYEEIQPDGSRVLKVVGEDFYITLVDHTLVVGGNLNITVQGDARLLVKGNMTQKIGGDLETIVHGNMITRVRGKSLLYSLDDMYLQTGRNLRTRSDYKTELVSVQDLNIEPRANLNVNALNGTVNLEAKTAINLGSKDGTVSALADTLNLSGSTTATLQSKDGTARLVGTTTDVYGTTTNIHGATLNLNKSATTADPYDGDTDDVDLPDLTPLTAAQYNSLDPSGGLTVEDSVMEPSVITQIAVVQNLANISQITDFKTFPKDRIPIKRLEDVWQTQGPDGDDPRNNGKKVGPKANPVFPTA